MRPQRPRVIRLSESSPPSNYDAVNDELNGKAVNKKETESISLVGSVKEKGFSTTVDKISLPQPSVTPFPVARHRSDGPHWRPPSTELFPVSNISEDDEVNEKPGAVSAEPLRRRKDGKSQPSQWRSNRQSERTTKLRAQNAFDDARQLDNSREASSTISNMATKRNESCGVGGIVSEVDRTCSNVEVKFTGTIGQSSYGAGKKYPKGEEMESKVLQKSDLPADSDNRQPRGTVLETSANFVSYQRKSSTSEESRGLGGVDSVTTQQPFQSGPSSVADLDIDSESQKALLAMSSKEIAEAQAELSQKLRPELLELLRRRGAEKEKTRLAELARGTSKISEKSISTGNEKEFLELSNSSTPGLLRSSKSPVVTEDDRFEDRIKSTGIPVVQTAPKRTEPVRGTKVGPADLLTSVVQEEAPLMLGEKESTTSFAPPTTDPWTRRVEAVRLMRFDLDGSVVPFGTTPESLPKPTSTEGITLNSQQDVLNVVERDYLRTEGDPLGHGYLLKEILALVRSTVAGQRAVALRMIASVLEKSCSNLQNQEFNSVSNSEFIQGPLDWQAVWAYALGPEAELVLSLRLALDDGHSTVVAACARAIQALLSYSVNESYFDSLEGVWPGDKIMCTAPIFRRKTTKNEGFIGGGHWKYNVKTREMFPFPGVAAQEKVEEEGKDTVADDGHIANKDVAAGLIRMGILPRIRYILEVDKLITAEEALLSVLICLARHSPTAANAVMKCPRLIDAIVQRFIGSDDQPLEESWSSRVKAVRLLKILSQANRSNCVYFEKTGTVQTMMGPLLRQSHANQLRDGAQDLDPGFYEIMTETIRFWRVCISYQIGISLFSDCYSALCSWLLPLSKEEILSAGNDEALFLTVESYLLLEHLAKTLPVLHSEPRQFSAAEEMDQVNWSWSVAMAMVSTAIKWLSPDCISGVHILLEQLLLACGTASQEQVTLSSSARNVLGVLAAVLHFLATACQKISSAQDVLRSLADPSTFCLLWLPTFVPQLGLALARSGLLDYSQIVDSQFSDSKSGTRHTLLECLSFQKIQVDCDSALVATNFLNAVVRVSSIVDKLILGAKPKGTPSLIDQTAAHEVLDQGLLLSAKCEMQKMLVLCHENVISRSHLTQMSERGGPAPGLGVGWGSLRGGTWSKEFLIAQVSTKLALELMSVSNLWQNDSQNSRGKQCEGSEVETCVQSLEASQRMNFGFAVVATSTPASREVLHQVISHDIFHPSILLVLKERSKRVLVSWRDKDMQGIGYHEESYCTQDQTYDPENLSRVLLVHCENFWLMAKKRKCHQDVGNMLSSNGDGNGLRRKLGTVEEESVADDISCPESLMQEWVGQRLPLPSHWFLSPLVVDLSQASKKDWESNLSVSTSQLEEVIKASLAFFLGFEVLAAHASEAKLIHGAVSLVWKIHSLSTVFVSGGEVFLHPLAQDFIGALQSLIGDQIGTESMSLPQQLNETCPSSKSFSDGLTNGSAEHGQSVTDVGNYAASGDDVSAKEAPRAGTCAALDFEGCIDASYVNYAEIIAEQFIATSFGDFVFARQVALHLCLAVPDMIRLTTWRVLTDARVLELLPPLSQCCGPPQRYLYPIEDNQEILEAYVSAWSSGALDKAAKRDSMPFTVALHHLCSSLFGRIASEKILLLRKKTIRTLVRSSAQKPHHQAMLSRLVQYVPGWPCSTGEGNIVIHEIKLTETMKSRLLFMMEACAGDGSLIPEVRRLQTLTLSSMKGAFVTV